jgi:hypothetical protein
MGAQALLLRSPLSHEGGDLFLGDGSRMKRGRQDRALRARCGDARKIIRVPDSASGIDCTTVGGRDDRLKAFDVGSGFGADPRETHGDDPQRP